MDKTNIMEQVYNYCNKIGDLIKDTCEEEFTFVTFGSNDPTEQGPVLNKIGIPEVKRSLNAVTIHCRKLDVIINGNEIYQEFKSGIFFIVKQYSEPTKGSPGYWVNYALQELVIDYTKKLTLEVISPAKKG